MKKGFEIILSDPYLVAVNKPAGLLSIPDRYKPELPNLRNLILQKYPDAQIVHRLDKETSGIIILARGEDQHRVLNTMFEERNVQKVYLALVEGNWLQDKTIDLPLSKSSGSGGRMVIDRSGKNAISHFRPTEFFDGWTLVEVEIETGRTHQIRAHAAATGHPIVCDPLYGSGTPLSIHQLKKIKNKSIDEDVSYLMSRVALHALSLKLTHPFSGEKLSLTAPLSKDFKASLNQLRKWRKKG